MPGDQAQDGVPGAPVLGDRAEGRQRDHADPITRRGVRGDRLGTGPPRQIGEQDDRVPGPLVERDSADLDHRERPVAVQLERRLDDLDPRPARVPAQPVGKIVGEPVCEFGGQARVGEQADGAVVGVHAGWLPG